jgi:hypothetical protein
MKKTFIAFSVTVGLSILLFLSIGLTGCDWFNTSVLRKPGKEELARKERDAQKAELDSIRKIELAKLEALKAQEQEEAERSRNVYKPFHIIVGAFEEFQNAENMVGLYKSKGYSPETFDIGGLRHVSAISFETRPDAETALSNILEMDYCEEAWILRK